MFVKGTRCIAHHLSSSLILNSSRGIGRARGPRDTKFKSGRPPHLTPSLESANFKSVNPDDGRASAGECAGRALVAAYIVVSLTHMCVRVNGDATDRCIGEGK